MSISFDHVPAETLTPFTYVEFNSSNAARNIAGAQPYKILVMGQRLPSGSVQKEKLVRVSDASEAAKFFGWNSNLHQMFRYLKKSNTQTETFAVALDDPGADPSRVFNFSVRGTAASAKYTITLRKDADNVHEVSFDMGESPTVAKILNGLRNAFSSINVATVGTITGSKLPVTVDSGWNVTVSPNLTQEDPAPELGRATGSIAVSGPARSNGILALYLGDRKYTIPVSTGASSSAIATLIEGQVNADDLSYVSASVAASTVTFSARHRGIIGNNLNISFNLDPLDKYPDGLETSRITQMTGGVENPDIATALSAIDEQQYNVIVFPYSDSANLDRLHTFLDARWKPSLPFDGHAFIAMANDHSSLLTFASSVNSIHFTIMDASGISTPPYLVAASLAGVNAAQATIDPARPQQTLELPGLKASESSSKGQDRRNALLKAGIATHTKKSGKVYIDRLVTTYTQNPLGALDISYRDVAVKQTLSYLRWQFRTHFMTRYPRHKLASSDARLAAGQAIITPKTAKAEAISLFRKWENRGLVEGMEQFKKELIVQISPNDPNRLEFYLPTNLINQLRVIGAQISFIL